MTPKRITFDIMLNGRFIATERIPITFDVLCAAPDGDAACCVDMDKVLAKVLEKRPTLKNKPYRICF